MEDIHDDNLDLKLLLYDIREKQEESNKYLKFIADFLNVVIFVIFVKIIAFIGIFIYILKSGADVISTIM